jgi:fermentation-respiration switch protein FrsA (DUF1100 family)
VLAAGLAALAAGCSVERAFIYFPSRSVHATPAQWGLRYEEAAFRAADGVRLHGWFVPASGGGPALLWAHGNGGNIADRLGLIRLLHDRLRISLFIFDYRGYGRSEGRPSEDGTYRDAEAALAYLRARPDVDRGRILYYGESLGSAVVIDLAAREPPAGLILEAPFTSVRDMARAHYPFLPVWNLLRTKYDSLSKIGRVRAPLLVVHGDRDEIVPFAQGRRMFDAASPPKELVPIRGAGHNDLWLVGGEAVLQAWARFLAGPAGQRSP